MGELLDCGDVSASGSFSYVSDHRCCTSCSATVAPSSLNHVSFLSGHITVAQDESKYFLKVLYIPIAMQYTSDKSESFEYFSTTRRLAIAAMWITFGKSSASRMFSNHSSRRMSIGTTS